MRLHGPLPYLGQNITARYHHVNHIPFPLLEHLWTSHLFITHTFHNVKLRFRLHLPSPVAKLFVFVGVETKAREHGGKPRPLPSLPLHNLLASFYLLTWEGDLKTRCYT